MKDYVLRDIKNKMEQLELNDFDNIYVGDAQDFCSIIYWITDYLKATQSINIVQYEAGTYYMGQMLRRSLMVPFHIVTFNDRRYKISPSEDYGCISIVRIY